MRVEVIRHVPYIYYGHLESWLRTWGADVWEKRFFHSTQYPRQEAPDLCVVLGGPMGVYEKDQYPWLRSEIKYLEERLKDGTKILAICLGAQIMAEILGSKVSQCESPEVGWHPVRQSKEARALSFFSDFPKEWVSFHWHYDAFETPAQATRIFESEAHAHQGFLYNDQVLATQFHPEMNEEGAKNLLWRFSSKIDDSKPWIQSVEEIRKGFIHECKNVVILHSMVDRLMEL